MADLVALPPGPLDKRPWDPYLAGLSGELWQRFRWFVDLCRDELGVEQYVLSGLRTYAEQKYLYDGWRAGKPGFARAAVPGTSKHEKGLAIDCGVGYSRYPRMKNLAVTVGFGYTVSGEDWHVEIVSHPPIPEKYLNPFSPPPEPPEDDMQRAAACEIDGVIYEVLLSQNGDAALDRFNRGPGTLLPTGNGLADYGVFEQRVGGWPVDSNLARVRFDVVTISPFDDGKGQGRRFRVQLRQWVSGLTVAFYQKEGTHGPPDQFEQAVYPG